MEKKNFILRAFGSYVTFVVYILAVGISTAALIYTALGGPHTSVALERSTITKVSLLISAGIALCHIGIICRLVFKLKYPAYLDIYVMVLATLAFVGGETFRLYDRFHLNQWIGLDKAMHFVAGGAFVMFGYSIALMLYPKNHDKKNAVALLVLFAFFFSLSTALLWEVLEFSLDSFLGTNTQRWRDIASSDTFQGSGLIDTMMDMIVHVLGAIPAAIFVGIWFKKHPDSQALLIMKQKDFIVKTTSNDIALNIPQERPFNETASNIEITTVSKKK